MSSVEQFPTTPVSVEAGESERILERNRRFIPGGVVSVNRSAPPNIAFARGLGALLWDADGNEYIDYHAAFGPHFLGHNDPEVTEAVQRVLRDEESLYGAGTTALEGELAELMCRHVPVIDSVQFLNSGSEATYQALRVARSWTGRDHIIVAQGGYNGWHNDVACNLMTPLDELGPRVSPGEYPFRPISAGIPEAHQRLVHPVNFNDLESVEYVARRYPVAAIILEPILQNVGVIRPLEGYLEGLRELADEHGFLLIFDEIKTGFRHALGGYAEICGVTPDLSLYGKALANGYPISAIGGRAELMNLFVDPDPERRVLLAGTYNAHPAPTAAAIATIRRMARDGGAVFRYVDNLGRVMQDGIEEILARLGVEAVVARQGSAFCLYFMDHLPVDWHDLASHHDFERDARMRQSLIAQGIFFFPVPIKQASISSAHTPEHVDRTLAAIEKALRD